MTLQRSLRENECRLFLSQKSMEIEELFEKPIPFNESVFCFKRILSILLKWMRKKVLKWMIKKLLKFIMIEE